MLAEAPVVEWAANAPEGRTLYAEFINRLWKPAGEALRKGVKERALTVTMNYFVGDGAYDHFPPDARQALQSNLREWQALTTSSDAFPPLSPAHVRTIQAPVLMLSAARTLPILKFVDKPEECRRAVLAFLEKH